MSSGLDRNETRAPRTREIALFHDLKTLLSIARSRAPALRRQLAGVDLAAIKKRADLAAIPIVRKSDLSQLQSDDPPLGGLAATRAGALKRLIPAGASIIVPEGHAKDWWNSARAMKAAGFGRGDIVFNCYASRNGVIAAMVESGASALGCATAPAGDDDVERALDKIWRLKPRAYCGPSDFLERLFARHIEETVEPFPICAAVFFDRSRSFPAEERLRSRGLACQACYATNELGVVAFQPRVERLASTNMMIVNEGLIVEILQPGTNAPRAYGEIGEVVVTRLNADFPLVRFATGDLSYLAPGPSPCGRTNFLFGGWLGRVEAAISAKRTALHIISERVMAGESAVPH